MKGFDVDVTSLYYEIVNFTNLVPYTHAEVISISSMWIHNLHMSSIIPKLLDKLAPIVEDIRRNEKE